MIDALDLKLVPFDQELRAYRPQAARLQRADRADLRGRRL